jgi:hypothetical protein
VPAAPERTVLLEIPDADDREIRVSVVTWPEHPDWPAQVEVADYIPSTGIYGRGYLFDAKHRAKVISGLKSAGIEVAARTRS